MNRAISALLLAIILLSIHGVVRSDDAPPMPVADADLLVSMRADIVLPPTGQALPEPAILIMMLLGIGVIGYRVRRDEPFS